MGPFGWENYIYCGFVHNDAPERNADFFSFFFYESGHSVIRLKKKKNLRHHLEGNFINHLATADR